MTELDISLPLASCILLLLLLLSAFFSSSETALTRARRVRLRVLSEQGNLGAKRAEQLLKTPEKILSAILLGNNFVNFAASSLTAAIFFMAFGDAGILYATIAMTIIVVIFAEVLPKTIAVAYAEPIACKVSAPLQWLMRIFSPTITVLLGIVNVVKRLLRIPQFKEVGFSHQELAVMVDMSAESGMLDDAREQMLASSLRLHEIPVKQLMVPRKDMIMLDANLSVRACKEQALKYPHSRFPVFLSQSDNILGIIHLRELIKLDDSVQSLAHAIIWQTPLYTPNNRHALSQLFDFQSKHQHMAIIVDEFGDIEGLITLEDIIEEIVGDIVDESDLPTSSEVWYQPDGSLVVTSTANVHDINQELDSHLPVDGATTIGGLIVQTLGDQPEARLSLCIKGLQLEVLSIEDDRIQRVRILKVDYNSQGMENN
ncbi:MAG: CNNM domain-containing protein [Mariprofundaceae bacterium]|nr:CNNM domain-containing protein [Mariprofundaceae bacterium]